MQKILLVIVIIGLSSCNNPKENKDTKSSNTKTAQVSQETDLEKSIKKGNTVYANFCTQCHLSNGKGIPGNFPPLANSDWLMDKRTESIRSVKYGQSGEIIVNGETYNSVMAPMGLSDEEVADVLNYIMNTWGNTQKEMVTKSEVAQIKE